MSFNQRSRTVLNTTTGTWWSSPTNIYPNTSNSTVNPSQDTTTRSTSFDTVKIFFYFVILLGSTFGNGMVAYIICSTRKMRNASNYLILNLAICDLLTPVISIPFDFALEENGYVWLYGGFMCRVFWPAATLTATSSALCLAVISLDRYRIIMHPYKPRLTPKQIAIAIVCTHVFSLACVIPYIYVLRLKDGNCGEDWGAFKYRQAYTAFLFVVQYALPLPFMVVMYSLALWQLYHSYGRTWNMRSGTATNGKMNRGKQPASTSTPLQKPAKKIKQLSRTLSFHSRALRRTSSANVRATKMFIVVVTVFAIFMLPIQVVWMWSDYGGGSSNKHFGKIMIICWLFTYTNCVCNPIIFTIFSKDFRNGFLRIFKPSYARLMESFSRSTQNTPLDRTPRSRRSILRRQNTLTPGENKPTLKVNNNENGKSEEKLWQYYKTTIYC